MDTLFRLVSLQSSDHQQQQQQQHSSSFNSTSRTSSSSRSSKHHHRHHHQDQQQQNYYYYYQQQQQHQHQHRHQQAAYFSSPSDQDQEECCNNRHIYMDEDFSSSSSSKHFHPSSSNPPNPNPNPNPSAHPSSSSSPFDPYSSVDFSLPQNLNLNLNVDFCSAGGRWAADLLMECARAIAGQDNARVQQLLWMLNELSSPYGDTEQKVASYFLQALFARLTSSGPRTLRTLLSASDRTASFDSTRRTALKFQELSPWSSFGHVASNGAILESFLDGIAAAASSSSSSASSSTSPQRLHILDLSNTFCTQWPTLLEALATRSADDTPHLTITTVVSSPSASSSSAQRVMKEIGARMEKFARLMGVPFKFNIVHHAADLSTLDLDRLNLVADSSLLAVNCVNALHGIPPTGGRRDAFIASLRLLRPRILTVVEEEADMGSDEEEEGFVRGFEEALRFFSSYLESLEESLPKTSNERLALERAAGRAVMDVVSCPAAESRERREKAGGWSSRMRAAGFMPTNFSDDVADDVRALLRRYREGWTMTTAADEAAGSSAGIFLAWKDEPVVWASAWRLAHV